MADAPALRQLSALLAERRAARGPARASVDERIWEAFGADLCVMTTDLAGFSRGVAEHGILHFLQVIDESVRLLVPILEAHGGRLLKVEGDSLMATFGDPRAAVHAAIAMQLEAERYNAGGVPATERLRVGIGLGWGRLLRIGDADVFGVEVNAACLLGEDVAAAGEILVTSAVRDAIGELPGVQLTPIDFVPPGTAGAWQLRSDSRG